MGGGNSSIATDRKATIDGDLVKTTNLDENGDIVLKGTITNKAVVDAKAGGLCVVVGGVQDAKLTVKAAQLRLGRVLVAEVDAELTGKEDVKSGQFDCIVPGLHDCLLVGKAEIKARSICIHNINPGPVQARLEATHGDVLIAGIIENSLSQLPVNLIATKGSVIVQGRIRQCLGLKVQAGGDVWFMNGIHASVADIDAGGKVMILGGYERFLDSSVTIKAGGPVLITGDVRGRSLLTVTECASFTCTDQIHESLTAAKITSRGRIEVLGGVNNGASLRYTAAGYTGGGNGIINAEDKPTLPAPSPVSLDVKDAKKEENVPDYARLKPLEGFVANTEDWVQRETKKYTEEAASSHSQQYLLEALAQLSQYESQADEYWMYLQEISLERSGTGEKLTNLQSKLKALYSKFRGLKIAITKLQVENQSSPYTRALAALSQGYLGQDKPCSGRLFNLTLMPGEACLKKGDAQLHIGQHQVNAGGQMQGQERSGGIEVTAPTGAPGVVSAGVHGGTRSNQNAEEVVQVDAAHQLTNIHYWNSQKIEFWNYTTEEFKAAVKELRRQPSDQALEAFVERYGDRFPQEVGTRTSQLRQTQYSTTGTNLIRNGAIHLNVPVIVNVGATFEETKAVNVVDSKGGFEFSHGDIVPIKYYNIWSAISSDSKDPVVGALQKYCEKLRKISGSLTVKYVEVQGRKYYPDNGKRWYSFGERSLRRELNQSIMLIEAVKPEQSWSYKISHFKSADSVSEIITYLPGRNGPRPVNFDATKLFDIRDPKAILQLRALHGGAEMKCSIHTISPN